MNELVHDFVSAERVVGQDLAPTHAHVIQSGELSVQVNQVVDDNAAELTVLQELEPNFQAVTECRPIESKFVTTANLMRWPLQRL